MLRILLLSAAMTLCLISSANVVFAQCGDDGTKPCITKPKNTTPKKAIPKTIPTTKTAAIKKTKPQTKQSVVKNITTKISTKEMNFVYISEGSFEMGGPQEGWETANTIHTVKISQGFWMQTTEITQAQWKAVMGVFPPGCPGAVVLPGGKLDNNKPMFCVSWDDAQLFVNMMNLKKDGYKYRLPTEAEWEYACRAGTTGTNTRDVNALGWYKENSEGYPHDVATKQANDWGLYDMQGNVMEWVQDWAGEYPNKTVIDPTGPASGDLRVYRGGSWRSINTGLQSWMRSNEFSSTHTGWIGFRVVRN